MNVYRWRCKYCGGASLKQYQRREEAERGKMEHEEMCLRFNKDSAQPQTYNTISEIWV